MMSQGGIIDLSKCTSAVGLVATKNTIVSEPQKDPSEVSPEDWDFFKFYGFNPPRPLGDKLTVMQYVKKLSDSLAVTESTVKMQRTECIVGRVLRLGSACFKGETFKNWKEEDLPKVGDWVTFRLNPGYWYKYGPPGKGVTVMTIYDDAVNDKVENPAYVDRE